MIRFLLLGIVAGVLCVVKSNAQQDPLYGLYLANPVMINPACAGMQNTLEASAGYRNQWAGFDGNPTTLVATANARLRDNNMGAAMIATRDKIGENTTTNINFAYAYKLRVLDGMTLNFGMQAGLANYRVDPSDLSIYDPTDPAFASLSLMKFNAGAGAMLNGDDFVVGFSVPRMLNNHSNGNEGNLALSEKHYYLFGSYFFYLSERLILKPSLMLRGVKGSPFSTDAMVNINIDRKFTAGAFTRNMQSYGLLAQLTVLENLKFSYSFEMPTNRSVGTRFVTNELMVTLQMRVFRSHDPAVVNGLL